MKARICECCKVTVPDNDKKQMLYAFDISEAEDYTATTTAEKKLLFSIDDVCSACTAKLKAAIEFILKGATTNERRKTRHRS
jgi:hypothetical protein